MASTMGHTKSWVGIQAGDTLKLQLATLIQSEIDRTRRLKPSAALPGSQPSGVPIRKLYQAAPYPSTYASLQCGLVLPSWQHQCKAEAGCTSSDVVEPYGWWQRPIELKEQQLLAYSACRSSLTCSDLATCTEFTCIQHSNLSPLVV